MARGRQDGPRRPRNLLERPVPWGLLTLLLLVVVAGATVLMFDQIRSSGGASGRSAFYLITILGVVALLLILSTFFYTLRKRRRGLQERMPGSMMAWFKSHAYIGVLALLVAVVHILTRPISSGLTTGKLALIVFAILVLSGIAWRAVYLTVPRRVAKSVGNLATVDTERRLGEIQVEIAKLAAGKSPQFQQITQARLQGGTSVQAQQQAAMLATEERADWVNVSSLADERDQLREREKRQHRYERILQRWKLVHIPLAVILLGLIAVHIADVFGAGRAAFGGEAKQFPSSRSCAGCHSTIAKEWRTSVMAHGVTSPLMIAQTALAVKKNADEGHPIGQLCVNCHGPVGAVISGSDTLPFKAGIGNPLEGPEATSPHDLILAEGVSCVICHALDNTPKVGEGADPFKINQSGLSSLGTMHGPALPGGDPIPVPDHRIVTGGYMGERDQNLSDEITTSSLCGACHVVQVDINGDNTIDRKADPQPDLVLQTTYLEWEQDYVPTQQKLGRTAFGCVGCHAAAQPGAIVDSAPFGQKPPERVVHNHAFVGVDYDLTPGHPGLTDQEFKQVLAERAALLQSAADLSVSKLKVKGKKLVADVEVTNVGDGHTLPTGFAFVRQMWLQVSAKDLTTGQQVCLAKVRLSAGGPLLGAPCASGVIGSAQEDLPYCQPRDLEQFDANATVGNDDIILAPGATKPPGTCDPYLASWQKILTDRPAAEASKDKPRPEVQFQNKVADIVAIRDRVFGNTPMIPMDAPGVKPKVKLKRVGDTETFPYVFALGGAAAGDDIEVTATLRFRHTSPYFLRSLGDFYPPGITADDLIKNLTVVDMRTASTKAKA
jgi:hypothetical protein